MSLGEVISLAKVEAKIRYCTHMGLLEEENTTSAVRFYKVAECVSVCVPALKCEGACVCCKCVYGECYTLLCNNS